MKKQVKATLTEKVLELFRGGSPLTWSETKRQFYGLPINKKELTHQQLYKTIKKITKQGWVVKKVKEDKIFYSLTQKEKSSK
jgi:DNA-binding PadR family transcriptional regulator